MKKWLLISACLIGGGILGFSATQSDINFMTPHWVYGSMAGLLLLMGGMRNAQRNELIGEIESLKHSISESRG